MLRFLLLSDANRDAFSPSKVQNYCAIAVGICVGGNIVALFAAQYVRARRSLSLRYGAQRRKWVSLFLALSITCFLAVVALSYADSMAQPNSIKKHGDNEFAASPRGESLNMMRTRHDNSLTDAENVAVKQVEVPSRYGCPYPISSTKPMKLTNH